MTVADYNLGELRAGGLTDEDYNTREFWELYFWDEYDNKRYRNSRPFSPPDTYITEPAHVYRMPILLGQQILANNYIFLLAWPEIHLICLDISLAMDIRYEEPLWPSNVILVHRVGHEHRM